MTLAEYSPPVETEKIPSRVRADSTYSRPPIRSVAANMYSIVHVPQFDYSTTNIQNPWFSRCLLMLVLPNAKTHRSDVISDMAGANSPGSSPHSMPPTPIKSANSTTYAPLRRCTLTTPSLLFLYAPYREANNKILLPMPSAGEPPLVRRSQPAAHSGLVIGS